MDFTTFGFFLNFLFSKCSLNLWNELIICYFQIKNEKECLFSRFSVESYKGKKYFYEYNNLPGIFIRYHMSQRHILHKKVSVFVSVRNYIVIPTVQVN